MIVSGRINWSLLHLNLTPVDIELLGKQRGQRGEYALAHFRLGYPQYHLPVRVNPDPGIERSWLCGLGCVREVPMNSEQSADGTRPGQAEELASSRVATQGGTRVGWTVTIPTAALVVADLHANKITPGARSWPIMAMSTTARIRQFISLAELATTMRRPLGDLPRERVRS